jgi:RNA polymerase sigma factor (sigma-70 family)
MRIQLLDGPYRAERCHTVDSEGHAVRSRHHSHPRQMTAVQFSEAFQRDFPVTIRFLLSRGASFHIAEEISQKAWTKGWECLGQLQKQELICPWVNSIAKNLLRNLPRNEQQLHLLPVCPSFERSSVDAESAEHVLAVCSPSDREILYASYVEGHTSHQLAGQLGVSAVALRVRLSRLRRALRSQFPAMDRRRPHTLKHERSNV